MALDGAPELSIVIPVYNEEESVEPLFREIREALERVSLPFEVIFVDDGSKDGSARAIGELSRAHPAVRGIFFRRNFGQTAAMAAGLEFARGKVLIFMDADGQNDPADIPALMEKMRGGADVVCGWRKDRKDKKLTRIIPSKIANALIRKLTGVDVHDLGCSLKAFNMDVLKEVKLYGEMHRFIPIYANGVGATITEVVVNHRPRTRGVSKYGLKRTFKVLLDIVTVSFLMNFLRRPMHFFGFFAFGLLAAAAVSTLVAIASGLFTSGGVAIFLMLLSVPLVLGVMAMGFLLMGVLAELQTRIYFESQGKPTYKVRATVGFPLSSASWRPELEPSRG
jgi:glycosyltransferase involved in cell wall biosynthesis